MVWPFCASFRSNHTRERDKGPSWALPLPRAPVAYFHVATLDRENKLSGSRASALSVRGSRQWSFAVFKRQPNLRRRQPRPHTPRCCFPCLLRHQHLQQSVTREHGIHGSYVVFPHTPIRCQCWRKRWLFAYSGLEMGVHTTNALHREECQI